MLKLAVLVSGRGSNLEALLEAARGGSLGRVEPRLVISNRADVRALDVARRHGVPSIVLERSAFATRAERDAAIGRALSEAGVEVAVLAGYDELLGTGYFASYAGRTINIHPSLLPAHGGRGMIGHAVHAAVIASGDRETGVSIHEVTPELDAGPLLAQRRVTVMPGETPERLAERVLVEEHRLLVETVASLAQGP